MKRVISFLLSLLLVSILLSGCVRADVDIVIKKNGKADVTILYAIQNSLASMSESEGALYSEEDIKELQEKGFTVEEYAQDDYSGYRLSGKDVEPSEITSGLGDSGTVKKEGSTCIIDLDIMDKGGMGELKNYSSMIRSAGGYFKIRITLPVEAKNHNATTVTNSGKTLEWDLLEMDPSEKIHAEFTVPQFPIIPIAIGLAIAAALAFIFLLSMKKKETAPAEPEAPAAPEQAPALGQAPAPAESAAPAEAAPAGFCPKCGSPLAEGDVFCRRCGAKL